MIEITIIVCGPVGCGKSALLGEIEIMLKAIGVPTRYADPVAAQSEKNLTHADWAEAIDLYQPSAVLVETTRTALNVSVPDDARDAEIVQTYYEVRRKRGKDSEDLTTAGTLELAQTAFESWSRDYPHWHLYIAKFTQEIIAAAPSPKETK